MCLSFSLQLRALEINLFYSETTILKYFYNQQPWKAGFKENANPCMTTEEDCKSW